MGNERVMSIPDFVDFCIDEEAIARVRQFEAEYIETNQYACDAWATYDLGPNVKVVYTIFGYHSPTADPEGHYEGLWY